MKTRPLKNYFTFLAAYILIITQLILVTKLVDSFWIAITLEIIYSAAVILVMYRAKEYFTKNYRVNSSPVKVQLLNTIDGFSIPSYKKEGDSGMDIRYSGDVDITINPGEIKVLPTGIFTKIPHGYEIQVRPKSGLASKEGIVTILGTVDSPFTGEIGVIITNISKVPYTFKSKERVAQIVLCKVETIEWELVSSLPITDRGAGGFGHTGKH